MKNFNGRDDFGHRKVCSNEFRRTAAHFALYQASLLALLQAHRVPGEFL